MAGGGTWLPDPTACCSTPTSQLQCASVIPLRTNPPPDTCTVCTRELSQTQQSDESYRNYQQPEQQIIIAKIAKLKHRKKRKLCGCWQMFIRTRGKTIPSPISRNQGVNRAHFDLC